LIIRTPEGVSFSLLLASPVSRFMAWTVDQMCILAAASLAGAILGKLGLLSQDVAKALIILAVFVLQVGYGMFSEWHWRGQTLGKRLLRLRVVDINGLPLQPGQVIVRNLLRFVDVLPVGYLVGGLTAFLNKRGQRLGDIAANTVVVRNPVTVLPDLDQIMAGKFNSLRDHPHLVARLRQQVGTPVATAALQAVLRRDEFLPDARVALFQDFTTFFRRLVEFPPDAVEGVADEQYVRNVVDVLFRTRPESGKPRPADPSLERSGPDTSAVLR
ncbi:MAG TPA: RDD family protein, partial [Roseimicrobium sp.]|nr:RDD family protein [Roseimicrobium sp.]